MSEQKYYVALKCDLSHRMSREIDCIGYFFHGTNEKVKSSTFTKSELAEIMDGALYKPRTYKNKWIDSCECESCENTRKYGGEWINPLIKLVPVEE